MKPRRLRHIVPPPARRLVAACAGAAVILATAACATAPASDPDRAEANRKRQEALEQMERVGQRNDDRPLTQ